MNNSNELLEALNILEKEKDISKDTLIDAIENSQFDIAPKATQTGKYSDEFCKYCPYKDVCYHAKADIRNIKSEMDKHFQLAEGSAGSDESDDDYVEDVEE